MHGILETLPGLLRAAADDPQAARAFVFAAWRHTAGKQAAEHAIASEFADGRLTVAVENENWRRELAELAPQMLFKLNAALGKHFAVRYIEFFVEPGRFEKKDMVNASKVDPDVPDLPPQVLKAAGKIEDPELKKAFLGAAQNTLALKRNYGR
ncbi:MAG: DUF721 domain-containing protein [Acidobacteria bacterium]|nr:DUF721 domain-containing protein [Acidobacteriota bacterium]